MLDTNNMYRVYSPASDLPNPFSDVYEEEFRSKDIELNFRKKDNPIKGRSIYMFVNIVDLPLLVIAVILMCISSVATPMQTVVYGKIFTRLSEYYVGKYSGFGEFMRDVKILCGLIVIIGFAKMVFTWLGVFAWMRFGEKQQTRARRRIFLSLLSKDIEWLDTTANIMGEISQINRCIEELRCGTSEVTGLFIQEVASIIALFVTAMVHSWSLTLVIIASAPVMALFGWIFGKLTCQAAELENGFTAQASKILDWSLASSSTIRVFNGKYIEIVKYNKIVDLSAKAYYKLANSISGNIGILRCLSLMMFVQGFWFGNYMIQIGKLKINDVFTCFTSCLMLGASISDITSLVATVSEAKAAVDKIAAFIDNNMETANKTGYVPRHCRGKIDIRGVDFQYANRPHKVLNNINVSFATNTINFIIGKSGSGKSTLSQLLLNFYRPVKGSIRIDGYEVSTLDQTWLTNNITLNQSNPLIVEQSLRNNIGLAVVNRFNSLQDVSDLLIEDACSFALLDDIIVSLANNLNTQISFSKLSGGQRQKVSIARAKIRDTPILILDEALNSLDIKNREHLLRLIKKWRKGKTTIIITHELNQIDPVDNVILMENGFVKYQGAFQELSSTSFFFNGKADKSRIEREQCERIQPQEIILNTKKLSIHDCLRNPVILKDLERNSSTSHIPDESPSNVMSVLAILSYCRQTIDNKLLIIIGLVFSILSGVSGPIFSYCFSKLLVNMVDTEIGRHNNNELIKWSCFVVGIAIFDGILHYLSKFILSFSAENWVANLRKLAFIKLNEQDMSYFGLKTTKSAEVTALLMNDTRDLRSLISEFLSISINICTMLFVGVVWSMICGWKLALVGIAFVPLTLIVTCIYSRWLEYFEDQYKTKIAILENHNHEVISDIKSIICLNLNDYFIKEFEMKLADVNKVGFKRSINTGFGIALSEMCTSVATSTILYYGMKLVGKYDYSKSQLLQVITLLTFTMANASSLLKQLPDIARGQRAATYIISLLKLEASAVENDGKIKPSKLIKKNIIRFQKVNFQYPYSNRNDLVLRDLSFSVDKNETIAIVGESGSGKSTVTSLLMRLHGVSESSITISNYDINNLDIWWLRDTISIVPQIPRFFEGSIYENLTYGLDKNRISLSKIKECLKLTNIYPFICSLPDGLQTNIGEGSNSLLSSGQLQRLSIARALIRNPKILILDECTSNLDSENTDIIISLIKNDLSRQLDITIIIITHNLEMMKIASRLLVLKNGSIVEQGDFDSLYYQKGELFRITNGLGQKSYHNHE